MGDTFPRLESKHIEMERERALLSPVFEGHSGPPTTPALVVHVEIRFTDPVIRSRYCRSYGSSPGFEPTDRICRGLVRRIERCSEEFITRKDSGALEMFKDNSYERKPQRFEVTFRILRRGKGEWAERTYRSYQKQPLTVAITKEVMLASHRMIGLFLRRHDEHFQWLDCPVSDADYDGGNMAPSRNGLPSLLSIPSSRFVEATQTFEFVPGYSIDLSFRSRNLQRKIPTFERRLKVTSAQTAPLTLFMSEDMLWEALQVTNHGLDLKKRDFENRLRNHPGPDSQESDDGALEIDLRISNHLGPVYSHVHRNIRSQLALFRDPEARDCDDFLKGIENYLVRVRDEADARINTTNDLEFKILELKGVGWSLREPAKFTLGPSTSYGRRTIQAALDRLQTGIGDVIRGHNIAIHINAHKRGHLILDKAIVAHEKRGKPRETFASQEDAETAFVSRLKARIQKDLDKVFEDSCSIDDIPEDEQDDFVRPSTPVRPEKALSDAASSPVCSPLSTRSSPLKRSDTVASPWQGSPRPRAQRVFSLSRRSTESVRSINFLKAAEDPFANNSRPSTAASEQDSKLPVGEKVEPEDRAQLMMAAEIKPAQRSFSLVSRISSSATRVSNASTLVEEQVASGDDRNLSGRDHMETGDAEESEESGSRESMTSKHVEVSPAAAQSRIPPGDASPSSLDIGTSSSLEIPSQGDNTSPTLSTVRKTKQSKMDSPEIFVDARESVVSPVPEGIAESELSSVLAGERSPRSDDEFSTAPSTPELSTGGSSPRHSLLITPTHLQTSSGTQGPVLLGSYAESESNEPEMDLQAEVTGAPSKESHGHPATDEYPVGQPILDPPPQAIAAPEPEAKAFDSSSAVADGQGVAASSDLRSVVVLPQETSDAESTSTPIPSTISAPSSASNAAKITASETQVYSEKLGAEPSKGSDSYFQSPDSPTPEVRTSDPNKSPDNDSVFHGPELGTVLGPDNTLETPIECHVSEAAGDKLGTGAGAETKPVEDTAIRDAPRDAQTTLRDNSDQEYGAESEAVPSDANVVSGTVIQGTEGSPEDDDQECTDEKEVPTSETGPDATEDTKVQTGSDGVSDGPGLVSEEQEKTPSVAEDVTQDVGPVEETEDPRSKDDVDTRASEIVVEERVEENDGPVSYAEAAHIEPEGQVLDMTVETVEKDCPITESGVKSETDLSEPGVAPETGSGESEQLDGQRTAPAGPGAEGCDDVADKTEAHVEHAEDDDAAEASDQDVVPEEQATAPEIGDEIFSNGEEASERPAAVPTFAEVVKVGNREQDVTETAEQVIAVTPEQVITKTPDQDVTETPNQDVTETPDLDVTETPDLDVTETPEQVMIETPEHNVTKTPDQDVTEMPEQEVADGRKGSAISLTELKSETEADTEPDLRSGPLLDDLADELGVQADDDVKEISGSEREVLELEISKEQGVEVHGPSQESTEAAAESKIEAPEPDIVDQELAQELEVQSGDIGEKGSSRLDEEAQTQAEEVAATEEKLEAQVGSDETGAIPENEGDELEVKEEVGTELPEAKSGPEVENDETAINPEDESGKREMEEDVGTEIEMPQPQFRDEEPVVAPAISAQDVAVPLPDVSAPSAEADKSVVSPSITAVPTELPAPEALTPAPVSVEDLTVPLPDLSATLAKTHKPDISASITTMPTELPPSELPKPAAESPKIEKEKPHLAPIPDLTKLASLPAFPEAPSTIAHARSPVDVHSSSTDSQHHSNIHSSTPKTPGIIIGRRPQTAGYLRLGLREPRFFEVGLRGALGDVRYRRASLPVQHLVDQEVPSAPASEAGGSSSSKSVGSRLRGLRGGVARVDEEGDGWGDEDILPKMVLLLAGAVVLGKLVGGSE